MYNRDSTQSGRVLMSFNTQRTRIEDFDSAPSLYHDLSTQSQCHDRQGPTGSQDSCRSSNCGQLSQLRCHELNPRLLAIVVAVVRDRVASIGFRAVYRTATARLALPRAALFEQVTE